MLNMDKLDLNVDNRISEEKQAQQTEKLNNNQHDITHRIIARSPSTPDTDYNEPYNHSTMTTSEPQPPPQEIRRCGGCTACVVL